jgi:deferrochelatase/peroxidase EfeB
MNEEDGQKLRPTRRGFIATTAGLLAAVGSGFAAGTATKALADAKDAGSPDATGTSHAEPFWGEHQGGVVTPIQSYTYFAAFDLVTAKREDVVKLFQAWTSAAARMAQGQIVEPIHQAPIGYEYGAGANATPKTGAMAKAGDDYGPGTRTGSNAGADNAPQTGAMVVAGADYGPGTGSGPVAATSYGADAGADKTPDSGETVGLPPARLTVTFGFGPGLFIKNGKDRYGLAKRRPEALVDMPKFPGEQFVEAHTGGDLSVQACADDPQVAFHAVRQLARIADGVAEIRWVQAGFVGNPGGKETPRNLMGFKDGTNNPSINDSTAMGKLVWVDNEGPAWMRGGSYMIVRRIRIALEHWDRMKVAFQEQTVGRHKDTGAPLGMKNEFDKLNLAATDKDGNPVTPENAHVRLAAAENNGGAQILRRPYSYNDGVNFTAERWPPWRQGMEYDAGLLFVCYQRDPRTGFLKIYDKISKFDMMNQFVTHVGGGLFACPSGVAEGGFLGQGLFDKA